MFSRTFARVHFWRSYNASAGDFIKKLIFHWHPFSENLYLVKINL